MMKKKYFFLWTMLTAFLFTSCEQGPTLQTYFVQKMEDPAFLIVNLPFKLDNLLKDDLTQDEQEALAGVGKLNLLFYRFKEEREANYKMELNQINTILENKKYQHLMDFKAFDKGQGKLLFEGETDRIEEGIVFVNAKKMGFGVLRILGTDINPIVLSRLVKKVDPKKLEEELKSTVGDLGNIY